MMAQLRKNNDDVILLRIVLPLQWVTQTKASIGNRRKTTTAFIVVTSSMTRGDVSSLDDYDDDDDALFLFLFTILSPTYIDVAHLRFCGA
jgi:hypothetical protein